MLTFVGMKKENGKGDELMGSNYIRFDWAMKVRHEVLLLIV